MDFRTFSSPTDVLERAITRQKILPIYSDLQKISMLAWKHVSNLLNPKYTACLRWYDWHPEEEALNYVKSNLYLLQGTHPQLVMDHSKLTKAIDNVNEFYKNNPEWSHVGRSGDYKGIWQFKYSIMVPYVDDAQQAIHPGDVCLHYGWNGLKTCYMLPTKKNTKAVMFKQVGLDFPQTSTSRKTHFRKIPIEMLSQKELDWLKEQEAEYGFRTQRNLTT